MHHWVDFAGVVYFFHAVEIDFFGFFLEESTNFFDYLAGCFFSCLQKKNMYVDFIHSICISNEKLTHFGKLKKKFGKKICNIFIVISSMFSLDEEKWQVWKFVNHDNLNDLIVCVCSFEIIQVQIKLTLPIHDLNPLSNSSTSNSLTSTSSSSTGAAATEAAMNATANRARRVRETILIIFRSRLRLNVMLTDFNTAFIGIQLSRAMNLHPSTKKFAQVGYDIM